MQWLTSTLLYIQPLQSNLDSDHIQKTLDESDLQFCNEFLCNVSQLFAAVIFRLPSLGFYLVLRALDTIEDDTTFF